VVISKGEGERGQRTNIGQPLQIRGKLEGGGVGVTEGGSANVLRLTVPNPVLVTKGGVGDSTFVDPVRILKDNFEWAIEGLLA